jgi:hypothetical protein
MEGCFRVIYHNKSQCVWDINEAYYIPKNTITGIYYGSYVFPSHVAKSVHNLLFGQDICACDGDKRDDKQCLKDMKFYVLAIKYNDTYVIHPWENDSVYTYIKGDSRTKKHKTSK